MSYFNMDTPNMFGIDTIDELCQFIASGGEIMTKKQYEENLKALEEKEGKLFTIREVSEMLHVPIDTIKYHISWQSVRTLKLRHYKTQQNVTLIPQDEVLKMMARNTSLLPLLRGLTAFQDDSIVTIGDAIATLEQYRKD